MSSSDLPEGPLTTEDFLRNKPKSGSVPTLVSQAPPDADMSSSSSPEVALNEQGILSGSQRFRLLRGILWQIPLFFAFGFIILLLPGKNGSPGLKPPSAWPIAAIISLAIVFFFNIRQGIDLIGGKVKKVVGEYWTVTEGSGKQRHTVYSIGNVVVRWNTLMRISNMINRLMESSLYKGTRYVVYYLPTSKVMVSYANARTGKVKKESIVSEVALASTSLLAAVICFLAAGGSLGTSSSTPISSANNSLIPIPYNEGIATFQAIQRSNGVPAIIDGTLIPVPTDTPMPIAAGLRQVFKGHANLVNSVAFSPDGKTILTGSDDQTAILWNVATGQPVYTFKGYPAPVNSVAFSPDAKTILTGSSDDMAVLWSTATGTQLHIFSGHVASVNSVAFSPDGKTILTGSVDRTAILWDTVSGSQLQTFSGHTSAINTVAFSPDGKAVLTGSADGTAILWDVASGRKLQTFDTQSGLVWSVTFSPDGRNVLTGDASNRAILWDAATGQQIRTFSASFSAVKSVAFSPDGKTILTGDDESADLWDVANGQILRTFSNGQVEVVWSAKFSPDGKSVLTGGADDTARLWDISDMTGKPASAKPDSNGTSTPPADSAPVMSPTKTS